MKIDYVHYCLLIKNCISVQQMTRAMVIVLDHVGTYIKIKGQEPLICLAYAVLPSIRCKTIVVYSPFQLLRSQVYIDFFCHNEYAVGV